MKKDAKQRLENAFIELMLILPFERISVTAICHKAQVSRKTFYNYFKDKYDVIAQIFVKDIIQTITELRKYRLRTTIILTGMYQTFVNKKEFYCKAILINGQNSLTDTMIKEIQKLNMEMLKDHALDETDREYITYYFAASQVMLLLKWISEGMKVPPEKLAYYFDYLGMGMLNKIIQDK